MSNEMQDQNRLKRFSEKRERIINWKTILLDLLPKDKEDDTYTEKLAHFIEMEYSILHATLELHKRSLVRFLKELKFSDEEQYLALLPGKKNADIDDNIEKKRQVVERIQMMKNVFPGIKVIKIPEEGFHSTSASSSSEYSSSPSPPSSDESGIERPLPVAKARPFQVATLPEATLPEATSLPSSSKKNKSRASSSQTRRKRPPPKEPHPQKMREGEREEYWRARKNRWARKKLMAEWPKTQEEKEREKIWAKRRKELRDKVGWSDLQQVGKKRKTPVPNYDGDEDDESATKKPKVATRKNTPRTTPRRSARLDAAQNTARTSTKQPSARGQTTVIKVQQHRKHKDFTQKKTNGGRKKKKRRKNKKGGRRTRKRSK